MKAGLLAIAAAVATGVAASNHAHGLNHAAFHQVRDLAVTGTGEATCGCSTVYYTTTGAPTRKLNISPQPSCGSFRP